MGLVLVGRLHTAGSILVSILSNKLVGVLHHATSLYQSWTGLGARARGIFDGGRDWLKHSILHLPKGS